MAELHQHAFGIAVRIRDSGGLSGHQTDVHIQLRRRHGQPAFHRIGILGGIRRQIAVLLDNHLPVAGRRQPGVVTAGFGDDAADLTVVFRIPEDCIAIFILIVDADGSTLHAVGKHGLVDVASRVDQRIGAFHFEGHICSHCLHDQIVCYILFSEDHFFLSTLGFNARRIIFPILAVFTAGGIAREVIPVFLRHFVPEFKGFRAGNIANTVAFPDTVTIVALGAQIPLQLFILFDRGLQLAHAMVIFVCICLAEHVKIVTADHQCAIDGLIVDQLRGACNGAHDRVRDSCHEPDQLGEHVARFCLKFYIILAAQAEQITHSVPKVCSNPGKISKILSILVKIVSLGILEFFIQIPCERRIRTQILPQCPALVEFIHYHKLSGFRIALQLPC